MMQPWISRSVGVCPRRLEVDVLVRHGCVEQAVADDDLLQRTLDAQPRALVGLEQAVGDAYAPNVLAGSGRAQQPHTVTKAIAQDAPVDQQVFGAALHLDAVRLFVGAGQAQAVAVDHQV